MDGVMKIGTAVGIAHEDQIARDREMIAAGLKANPGRGRTWLDSAVRARMKDDAFLLAALPNDSISPEIRRSHSSARVARSRKWETSASSSLMRA